MLMRRDEIAWIFSKKRSAKTCDRNNERKRLKLRFIDYNWDKLKCLLIDPYIVQPSVRHQQYRHRHRHRHPRTN